MIKNFKCRDTERLFDRENVRCWGADVQRMGRRKLEWMDAAKDLVDLRLPPETALRN